MRITMPSALTSSPPTVIGNEKPMTPVKTAAVAVGDGAPVLTVLARKFKDDSLEVRCTDVQLCLVSSHTSHMGTA